MKEDVLFFITVFSFLCGILAMCFKTYYEFKSMNKLLFRLEKTLSILQHDVKTREIHDKEVDEKLKTLFYRVNFLFDNLKLKGGEN